MAIDIYISSLAGRDAEDIDEYLIHSKNASPYHHRQWLEAIKTAYGYKYSYFIARENNELVGVFPVCLFKDITGSEKFCSLPYCDIGGIVSNSQEIREELIRYAIHELDLNQSKCLEIRERNETSIDLLSMNNAKVSMLLDLPDNSELLLKSFKAKLRSQIKKSEKNGLTFDFANDPESVSDFYTVFSKNMHSLGSPTHSRTWFNAVLSKFKENMLVGRVWHEGKVIAAGILLFSGGNVSIPWASTLREYNRLAPNMLLYWNLLRISCDRGCKVFDFGRSTYQEGTYKFKQQWGAQPKLLSWNYLDSNGCLHQQEFSHSGKSRKLIESVWKKIPLSVANILGPIVRKRISL